MSEALTQWDGMAAKAAVTNLADKLVANPVREKGGGRSTQRLDFQAGWGLSHLIELHVSGADYAVAFEFHDDVIVIDSATNPSRVRFYQVKTRPASENWTIARLAQREEAETGPKPSILAKMLSNKRKFVDETEVLGFVSNRPCSFLPSDPTVCCAASADKETYKDFLETLQKEVRDVTEDEAKLFHFHYVEIPISDSDVYVKGKVEELVSEVCGEIDYKPDRFYSVLAERCRKRSKKIEDINNFSDLIRGKFITRENMIEWLKDLERQSTQRPQWAAVSIELGLGLITSRIR